ncbi:hypothetical protein, partial [Hydrogenophaga electricum]|uniref:hypothetical protein n=1 Tax=Hydrogenophaga electricum TaxID=1230953 RepID=UPI0024E14B30
MRAADLFAVFALPLERASTRRSRPGRVRAAWRLIVAAALLPLAALAQTGPRVPVVTLGAQAVAPTAVFDGTLQA